MATPLPLHFLIPGDLSTRTGGYEYDRRIVAGLRRLGQDVHLHALDGSFPFPSAAALAQADATLAGLPNGSLVLIDGLALGAMPDEVHRHAARLRLVALVHHPLGLETGLDEATAARLLASERHALSAVRGVVVTSRRTMTAVEALGVPAERISVVEPGTDAAALARGSTTSSVALLCVASLSPRKGHAVLFAALAPLRHLAWHLTCVGSTEREAEYVGELRRQIAELDLQDRIELAGEADAARIGAFYDRSDLFVLPTFYEGYGMVIAEALAHGLPVISTPTGAIAELVTPDCGILVPAGDVDGWRTALSRMFDPGERARLAAGAARRRGDLQTWEASSQRMAAALNQHG